VWRAYELVLRSDGTYTLNLLSQQADEGPVTRYQLSQGDTSQLQPDQWTRVRVSIVGDRLRAWLFDQMFVDVYLSKLRPSVPDGSSPRPPSPPLPPGPILPVRPTRTESVTTPIRPPGPFTDSGTPHIPIPQGKVGLYAEGDGASFRNPRVRSAILYSSGFTTSAFGSIADLIKSYEGSATTSTLIKPFPSEFTVPPTNPDLALQLWEWHRHQIDYRFEALKGGRETLEQSRLALREARAAHDETFRSLHQYIGSLFYQPFAPRLEVYLLRDSSTDEQAVRGIWVRSPESLDLRMDVRNPPPDGTVVPHVGRTALKLNRDGDGNDPEFRLFHDADSTQLLLIPQGVAAWGTGTYQLTFTYSRDHEDETAPDDHRYDRPIEMSNGRPNPETVQIAFTV
jgi:hypothetical protein